MTIPGSQIFSIPEISIDYEKCTSCGACASVCSGYPLYMKDGKPEIDNTRGFGCMACGACMAVCPQDAIRITGRNLFPDDVFPIPPPDERTKYENLHNLLLSRRSTRIFKQQEIEGEIIQKILDSASSAPVGIPPSEVGVCVFQTQRAVQELRHSLISEMNKWRWMFSPFTLAVMRPFIGKENAAMYKDFMAPAMEIFSQNNPGEKDWFFYHAPLAIYFYGNAYSDPADPIIPATYAMLAGEALGLGTCMLGFPGYIIQYSSLIRKKYHLPKKIQPGLMVAFGYPVYKNVKAIHRRFREVATFQ